jgi:hypothetical protein
MAEAVAAPEVDACALGAERATAVGATKVDEWLEPVEKELRRLLASSKTSGDGPAKLNTLKKLLPPAARAV